MVLRLDYVILVDDKKEVANTEASNFFLLSVPSMVQFLSGVSPDTGIYRQV